MREQQTLTFKRADDATVPVLGCDFCQLILFLLEGIFSCFCCSCECKDWMGEVETDGGLQLVQLQ